MTTNISSPRDSKTKQASPRDPTPESMKYLSMGDNFCLYFLMGGEDIWLEMQPLLSSLSLEIILHTTVTAELPMFLFLNVCFANPFVSYISMRV